MTAPSCANCGSPLAPGTVFCENCGARAAFPMPVAPRPMEPQAGPPAAGNYFAPTAASAVNDALLGATTPNETYLGNRLTYAPITTEFDPVMNRDFVASMFARAFLFSIIWFISSAFLFVVLGLPGLYEAAKGAATDFSSYPYGDSSSGGGSSALLYVWLVVSLLWTVGLWGMFWFTKIASPLSEWMLTVDGKAAASRLTLEHMNAIIVSRRLPTDSYGVAEVRPRRGDPRYYLQLVDGCYLGFVASFAYGSDLFIGWTFSLNQSPARWLWIVFTRTLRALTLRQASVADSLGYDTAKAMREVMHSAVRQGVDAATEQVTPVGQGLLGNPMLFTVPG